jgi:hypothetical protein
VATGFVAGQPERAIGSAKDQWIHPFTAHGFQADADAFGFADEQASQIKDLIGAAG